ncbi:MAG: condensation domain-containing protein [Pseudomonadota bacterium]|nr:condensation domain-containing protein [Pseudomonadota bacterium]
MQQAKNYATGPDASSGANAPLTFQQEFALSYVGENFFGVCTARLSGRLDVEALERSVNEVLRRHQALRTQIVLVDGALVQCTAAFAPRSIEIVNLLKQPGDSNLEVESYIDHYVEEWKARADTTFEVRLLQTGAAEWVFVLVWDHAFTDHHSGVQFFREFWSIYQSEASGSELPAAAIAIQYPEYAFWQRSEYPRWASEHGAYWQQRLGDAPPMRLPLSSTTGGPPRFAHQAVSFGRELSAALELAARRAGVSFPLLMLTITSIAVSRWSGQQEFVIPYTFAGRYHPTHLQALGYFPTPLLIKADLGAAGTFAGMMRKLSGEFITAVGHLDIGKPLEGGVPDRLNGLLFQWFPANPAPNETMATTPDEWSPKKAGITVEPFDSEWRPSQGDAIPPRFIAHAAFWKSAVGIVGGCGYRADAFSQDAVHRFTSDLIRIAESIAADANAKIDSVRN